MKATRVLLLLLTFCVTACTSAASLSPPEPKTPTVLITGASRGIGYELARQYADLGWGVIATCRNPSTADALQALAGSRSNVIIESLDVTDFAEMDELAVRYKGVPIDVLLNNAGILGGNDRQKFGQFDYTAFDEIMAVNVIGPIRMVELFVDNVALSEQKKIINISSSVGSIAMAFPGQNFYKASKSALNMSMKIIAKELKGSKDPNRKQIVVGLIHPGVVRTEFAGNVPIPMIEPEESAAGIIEVIQNYYVTRRQSGDFMSYTGSKLPW
ncbi:MAG: SDR family oxidoreductase [Gammaproteobacteria bacterium]|nr:SDR family oxidoreductase [Gammaproteobacteria bacterium]MCP4089796.1 SDR family oxidoreductase [Gammaproteobacteria bacterium]MCP4278187.1 SDR family oxidoreductase [Gammaproteobacteria bacterium]MCP4831906.1 SDR family oxidoreductase [Gammaproteobacteria bacterium]MCP4927622.1 SDR family oxidoreductase [Gammaproteobacteria bacterium]